MYSKSEDQLTCTLKADLIKLLFISLLFKIVKNLYCYRKFGVAGLYKGMEAKVIQTVLTAALMFTVYEKIANFVLKIMLTQPRA